VPVAGDDRVSAGGERQRDEAVVAGIRRDRRRLGPIVEGKAAGREHFDIRANLVVRHESCELGTEQHVLELVKKVRRDDEVELAVAPAVEKLGRRTAPTDGGGDQDSRVEDDPKHKLVGSAAPLAAHRVQLLVCEAHGGIFVQVALGADPV